MAGRGGSTIGKDLPEGHVTFSGLSEVTGVPVDTLRRWHKAGRLGHSYTKTYGMTEVNVFTLDDIVQAKKLRDEGAQAENSSSNTSD